MAGGGPSLQSDLYCVLALSASCHAVARISNPISGLLRKHNNLSRLLSCLSGFLLYFSAFLGRAERENNKEILAKPLLFPPLYATTLTQLPSHQIHGI